MFQALLKEQLIKGQLQLMLLAKMISESLRLNFGLVVFYNKQKHLHHISFHGTQHNFQMVNILLK
jgi:hypothetical protein